jgi:hypothetical protein
MKMMCTRSDERRARKAQTLQVARAGGLRPAAPAAHAVGRVALALLCAQVLAGCMTLLPPASESEALQRWGVPTGRYTLADGTMRLEYASGPYGRATWMLDLGPQGQVVRARQVLKESELMAVQGRMPMPASDLLRWVGRPGETRHGGRAGGQLWAWRYETHDCLWFLVSVDDAQVARNAAFMIDPRCDTPSDARN